MKTKNITIINIITSILLQFCMIISGLIIPKLIISTFGSEVNGLISSINQFLSYISLLEGGVTAVIISKLYKPLIKKDTNEISSIIKTADIFYKKIGILFLVYSIILAIICPLFYLKTKFSYIYIFLLTLILSISLLIQYMLSLSLKCLLTADKKVYIVSLTQILVIISNIIFAFISVRLYPNIFLFKFLTGISYIIQPVLYNYFIRKYYKLDKNATINNKLIKDRWNGFANNIAYFIHSSTDVTILTFMTSLTTVSVYSIYSTVTLGVKSLVGAINNGVFPTIGQLYAKGDDEELRNKYDLYEFTYFYIVFLIFSIMVLLITPFVMIYVGNDNANNSYYQPTFGILISIGILFDLLKIPHVNLSYSANMFKKMTIPSFIEALINIIISLILVNKIGLSGVAIGTICAMIYRFIFQIFLTKKIIKRDIWKTLKNVIVFTLATIMSIIICKFFCFKIEQNIFSWIAHAVIYCTINTAIITLFAFLFLKDNFNQIVSLIKKTFKIRKKMCKKNNEKVNVLSYDYDNNGSIDLIANVKNLTFPNNTKSEGSVNKNILKEIGINNIEQTSKLALKDDLLNITNENKHSELEKEEIIKKNIRMDNNYIKKIDFNKKYSFDIIATILSETKIYNFQFKNEYFLRNGKYPTILCQNHQFMKYIIDKDFNNIAYIDTDFLTDEELKQIINYAFRKVYYLQKEGKSVTFDINGIFNNSKIIENEYFKECLKYIKK